MAPRKLNVDEEGQGRGRGRPGKSLQQHLDDGTFERRKHEALLITDELVDDAELRKLQQRYRRLRTEGSRGKCSLEFEKQARAKAPDRNDAAADAFAERIKPLGRPGTADFVIGFFEEFYVWDDGSPWLLDPFQKDFLRELCRRDRQRRRIYQEILLGICRGQGKTPIASGLGCEELATASGRMNGYQIAGSKLQAGLGTEYATNWIDDSKDLQLALRARANSVVRRDGRGAYTVLSSDGRLSHGRHGRILAILDELWLYRTEAEVQGYTAMESALHKHPESYLLAISTAGYDKRSLLGRKYRRGLACPKVETRREGFLTIGRDEEAGFLLWWYGMPDGYELDLENDAAVLRALKLANPGSWTDYRAQLRSLKRAMNGQVEENDDIQDVFEWLRLCLNYWTAVKGSWLRPGIWRALEDKKTLIPRGADVYVGVDAAHSYDTTAVSWSWVDPATGRVVTRCRIFSVRKAAPAHVYVDEFYDPRANEHVAERFIHELADVHGFRVREVVADPNYFGGELARLGLRFLTAPIYPQSKEMREYVQRFYRDVAGRQIVTDGDPIVTAHVEAIQGEKNGDGYWTIRALHQSEPIDGGIAEIISNGRARITDRRDVSVYEKRGLTVLGESAPAPGEENEERQDRRSERLAYDPDLARRLGLELPDEGDVDEDELEECE